MNEEPIPTDTDLPGSDVAAVALPADVALMTEPEPEWLTVKEVAAKIRVTPETVRWMIRQGRLPAYRLAGHRIVIKQEAVAALYQYLDPATYPRPRRKTRPPAQ